MSDIIFRGSEDAIAGCAGEDGMVPLVSLLGIGTLEFFMIRYNIDISLTIRYLNNNLNNTACHPQTYFCKFSTVSFGIFANL